jgi:hypothetical protein
MRACVIACVPVATVVLLGLRCSLLWPLACTAIGCEHCLRHVLIRNCGHCSNLWWPLLSPLARCEPNRGHGGRDCGHCCSAWWPLLSPLPECQRRPWPRMPQLWPLLDCRVATVESHWPNASAGLGHGCLNCGHCWIVVWPLLSAQAAREHRPWTRVSGLWPLLNPSVATV